MPKNKNESGCRWRGRGRRLVRKSLRMSESGLQTHLHQVTKYLLAKRQGRALTLNHSAPSPLLPLSLLLLPPGLSYRSPSYLLLFHPADPINQIPRASSCAPTYIVASLYDGQVTQRRFITRRRSASSTLSPLATGVTPANRLGYSIQSRIG